MTCSTVLDYSGDVLCCAFDVYSSQISPTHVHLVVFVHPSSHHRFAVTVVSVHQHAKPHDQRHANTIRKRGHYQSAGKRRNCTMGPN